MWARRWRRLPAEPAFAGTGRALLRRQGRPAGCRVPLAGAPRRRSGAGALARRSRTPRARIQAIIDANLAPEEFDRRTGTAWLAFWGQVLQVPSLRRVQSVYQRRTLTNLKSSLKKLVPREEAQSLAAMIAAMIDGVWLRAALSGWREADSESARALLDGVRRPAPECGACLGAEEDARVAPDGRVHRRVPGGAAALRVHQSGHRRGARLRERRRAGGGRRGRARRAARPGSLGRDDRRRARPDLAPGRADPARAQPGARRARDARHRQADSGDAGRRRRLRARTASSISRASRNP